ncbi:MAG: low molecular weight phosphatase family protein [Candidatus Aenigmarchaeota archaeon]|nr:low molecular weight phosphatase family protein [Candidatus Aenigmarchaeota archaeon]
MKILFICRGNVGRSQMAEAFYNHYTKSINAFSAGVTKKALELYPKMDHTICKIMKEKDIDVSRQRVKLLTRKMVAEADEIFAMCQISHLPNYLSKSKKVKYWKIKDPVKMNLADTRKIRNKIDRRIKSLIKKK